jgi:hypothetical protein
VKEMITGLRGQGQTKADPSGPRRNNVALSFFTSTQTDVKKQSFWLGKIFLL